jgi:hypothetical protein
MKGGLMDDTVMDVTYQGRHVVTDGTCRGALVAIVLGDMDAPMAEFVRWRTADGVDHPYDPEMGLPREGVCTGVHA